jgi:uncharacterized protein (DUF58 family)
MRAPRRLKVTRRGKIYLGLVLGVGVGALNTGNNLLYLVLGLMLSTIVASGILSERSLRHLEVRRVGTHEAYAGEPFLFRWALKRNRGVSFALTLRELGVSLEGEGHAEVILPGEERQVLGTLVAPKRGPLALRAVEVSTLFPLGLFAKSRTFDFKDTLLIFPRRITLTEATTETGSAHGDSGSRRARDGGGDLLGLRELLPGEDARRIHWFKSAAAGRALRAEREDEHRRQVVLELDAELSPLKLEPEIERTAARARLLFEQGVEVGLQAGPHRLRPGAGTSHAHRLWSALAWLGHREGSG